MNTAYFENIVRYCQECEKINYNNVIRPIRRCIRNISGIEIKKEGVFQLPDITLKKMVEGSTKKYVKMTDQIIYKIQNGKRKGIIKYQTLGYKQAKEIKLWCDENNINCNIITDQTITRNKLVNIDIWHDKEGNLYNDGCRDYGNQYLDFRSIKQNVVYVQVSK
jgi:hypothetical protein